MEGLISKARLMQVAVNTFGTYEQARCDVEVFKDLEVTAYRSEEIGPILEFLWKRLQDEKVRLDATGQGLDNVKEV